jgi:hypothetical protein
MFNNLTTSIAMNLALGATSPFTKIKSWLNGAYSDILSTGIIVFAIGFVICAIGVWRGSDDAVPRFQKGLIWTAGGVIVAVLSKVIVAWVQGGVA